MRENVRQTDGQAGRQTDRDGERRWEFVIMIPSLTISILSGKRERRGEGGEKKEKQTDRHTEADTQNKHSVKDVNIILAEFTENNVQF